MLAQAQEAGRKTKKSLIAVSPMHGIRKAIQRTHWIPPEAERVDAILGEEGFG